MTVEKVRVTREQADRIESKKGNIENALRRQITNSWASRHNLCLEDLTIEEFATALIVGYEVKECFEVGDWISVYTFDFGRRVVAKIIALEGIQYRLDFDSLLVPTDRSIIRHATPEEIEQEEDRRTERKLDNLLADISNDVRIRLLHKLSNND